jgi:hypothetical protein
MEQDNKTKLARAIQLSNQCYDPNTYDFDDSFRPYDGNPLNAHTTAEMLESLKADPSIELDARILGVKGSKLGAHKLDSTSFKEAFKKDPWAKVKFKETDSFALGYDSSGGSIGNDFTPLLGGPFYKNLYYYQDYIRMHSEAFYAYHHDPIARAIVQITRDFVLGTGYELQCDTSDKLGQLAMATWRAFEAANDLPEQMDQCVTEQSVYGETMWWWLPKSQAKITYQLGPNDKVPIALIPRIRLIDPSNIVEIVTYPEDISRALFYVWLTPTQYQMYTSGTGTNQSTSQPSQPTLKFIYQQIPAEQMMHFKINGVSNEKRGRSDLFPVFSYLKRLRDSVNFSLIALQKASSWAIDTEIDGDQTDIDNYQIAQAAIGTIPPAGSEFVHSTKIKRTILASQGGGKVPSDAFSWCLSMIASGVGIPISYFGTHLSGGQTKASALVATEPVAKKMEKRREIMKRMLRGMWDRLLKEAGLPPVDCSIVFPEIITQDRSQKLKDLLLMQQSRWISPQRAASIAAKEMGIANYHYEEEIKTMTDELPEIPMPLSDPGKVSKTGVMQLPDDTDPGVAGLTGEEKEDAKDNDSHL